MPLLEEAEKLNALACFGELPIDLQVTALRHLLMLAQREYAAIQRHHRLQRAWYEIDLENLPQAAHIIE